MTRPRWARAVPWALSALLCGGLTFVYLARPDACAAITVFPAWAWLLPGLFLAAFGLRRRGNRAAVLVLGLWLVFLLLVTEEPWSLARSLVRYPPASHGEVIRVISLNCAIGSVPAADEVFAYRPDIVLLQESPNLAEVEALAKRLFGDAGGIVHGVDASVIASGQVIPAVASRTMRGHFSQARVILASGREIEVICTRLVPAVFRLDLWSPDCWREQAENRRKRREQLGPIVREVERTSVPVIVGGDFNAPQGDAVFRLFQPRLHDSFAEAGRGWGNTIINEFPALRIDQVWVSEEFRTQRVVARRTRHSDHRMVICDLVLRDDWAAMKDK